MPQAGITLGGYKIERQLGRGGMGTVFLAYDTTLRRQVALKTVDVPADGETSHTRLLREARNAAALNHPNICTIYEVGEANGAAFIAMEYVEGRSLSDRLGEGALSLEDALRYGIQGADALAYAHDHGVVHRDFKAANVIVTEAGRVKIVDFGLARRGDAMMASATTMASLVPAGAAVGTPYAMAPEQLRGDVTDARTDLWALGVLLYQMVTGAMPFNAATIPELFSSILRDSPIPLPHTVPVEMKAVIERCLDKEPERRYQRASEVGASLARIMAGTVSPSVTWRYGVSRRRWLASAASLLGVGAVLVGFNVGGVRDRLPGSPPETDIAIPPPVSGQAASASANDRLKWDTYQENMAEAHAKILSDESSPRLLSNQKAEAWRQFLSAYRDENPLTADDERMREHAQARLEYWERQPRAAQTSPGAQTAKPAPVVTAASPATSDVEPARAEVVTPEIPAVPAQDVSPRPDPEQAKRREEQIRGEVSRADQLFERADYDGAVKGYEAVLGLDPNHAAAQQGIQKARRAQAAEAQVLRRLK